MLKTDVTNHTGPLTADSPILLDMIPNFDEFDKIKEMIPKPNESKLFKFKDLIDKLWVPTVHYQDKECPDDCGQKTKCCCIRGYSQITSFQN